MLVIGVAPQLAPPRAVGSNVADVELVDKITHSTLAYLAAVNHTGAALTLEQLESFATAPSRKRPIMEYEIDYEDWATEIAVPGETTTQYLLRVSWIDASNDQVTLTPLGRAVLSHAERPPLVDASDGPLTVSIDPRDPLAYERIFGLINAAGPGMLVDPYLSFEGLADLATISMVTRALTSNRDDKRRLNLLGRVLGVAAASPEVRTVAPAKIHDRFFIPDHGTVYVLGSSLNSISKRPGVLVPIADEVAAGAIRGTYEEIWEGGVTLPDLRKVDGGAPARNSAPDSAITMRA